jgi:hypothetical protein
MAPVPQHTPPKDAGQSGAPSHCQSVECATGHAVPLGSHVDSIAALSGGSQQCSPAAQKMLFPPSGPLKGQYTPGAVSGKTSPGGAKQLPEPLPGALPLPVPQLTPPHTHWPLRHGQLSSAAHGPTVPGHCSVVSHATPLPTAAGSGHENGPLPEPGHLVAHSQRPPTHGHMSDALQGPIPVPKQSELVSHAAPPPTAAGSGHLKGTVPSGGPVTGAPPSAPASTVLRTEIRPPHSTKATRVSATNGRYGTYEAMRRD